MLIKCAVSAFSALPCKSSLIASSWNNVVKPSLVFDLVQVGVRHAGHSKWQNIKHTKAAKDLQKNQLYNRHIESIKLAVREGKSTNPKNNSKLAKCLETAKKEGVATTTVAGVLKKLENSMLHPKPMVYEYRGSNGVLVVITANTDNKNRTRAEINYFTKRYGLIKADNIQSAFDYKGYVYARPPSDTPNADEKALEDAIEIGAEEVRRCEENPDVMVFNCDGDNCSAIRSKLESRNYQVENSEEVFEARSFVELDEEEAKKYYEAFEKIDEIHEVGGIYTNLA